MTSHLARAAARTAALTLAAVALAPAVAAQRTTTPKASADLLGANGSVRTTPSFEDQLANALESVIIINPSSPGSSPAFGIGIFFRTIDGSFTNPFFPSWGMVGVELRRVTTNSYGDGISTPARAGVASPRQISNDVVAQGGSIRSPVNVSDFVWQWGQFVDHDIDLTPEQEPHEPLPIAVPLGDAWFDPGWLGGQTIGLNRSIYDPGNIFDPARDQLNLITAYIDASNVYGSDDVLAMDLRTGSGGALKMDPGQLLPDDPNDPGMFLAGDVRANEQIGLTSMHTLFVREHNTIAAAIDNVFPFLGDDLIYQLTRTIVWAEMQAITYNEFVPALLGPNALSPYGGWDPFRNAGIANFFSTASYRFGHSMLSPVLRRLNAAGNEILNGHVALKDAFFNPQLIKDDGIEPVIRGLAGQVPQAVDVHLIDDIRNFLFGPPGAGGFDLASLNMQRGRDHGMPSYTQARLDYGLTPVTSFAQITSDATVQANLQTAYGNVNDIDPWLGGLAEDPFGNALVGELVFHVLARQFEDLRDGDRFFYRGYLPQPLVQFVESQTLAEIIRRNTTIDSEISDDVFHVTRP